MAKSTVTVQADEFGNVVYKVLRTWCDSVPSAAEKACNFLANKTKRELTLKAEGLNLKHTAGSPKAPYAKCFKVEKAKASGWKVIAATVYNTKYSKTTWLEHGHVIKGRYANAKRRHTSPRPHWQPVYEWAEKQVVNTLIKYIGEIKI